MNCPPFYVKVVHKTTSMKPINKKDLAKKTSAAILDWLYEYHYDDLHEICHSVVRGEHPEIDEDELWEILPDVFDMADFVR